MLRNNTADIKETSSPCGPCTPRPLYRRGTQDQMHDVSEPGHSHASHTPARAPTISVWRWRRYNSPLDIARTRGGGRGRVFSARVGAPLLAGTLYHLQPRVPRGAVRLREENLQKRSLRATATANRGVVIDRAAADPRPSGQPVCSRPRGESPALTSLGEAEDACTIVPSFSCLLILFFPSPPSLRIVR
jgi:hypothetical protein